MNEKRTCEQLKKKNRAANVLFWELQQVSDSNGNNSSSRNANVSISIFAYLALSYLNSRIWKIKPPHIPSLICTKITVIFLFAYFFIHFPLQMGKICGPITTTTRTIKWTTTLKTKNKQQQTSCRWKYFQRR